MRICDDYIVIPSMNSSTPTAQPYTPSLNHQNTERCLFSFRILHRSRLLACCLPCFYRTGLVNRVRRFQIFISHHLIHGRYRPCPCIYCDKDTIQARRAIECPHCLNNYTKIVAHFRNENLPYNRINYLFDNLHEQYERLTLLQNNDARH